MRRPDLTFPNSLALALSIWASCTTLAAAQEEIRLSFTGETLTPEQRKVLAEVLAPNSELAVLSRARLLPSAAENTFDEANLEDLAKQIQSLRASPDTMDSSFLVASQHGQSFAVIDRRSQVAARLGIPDLDPVVSPPNGLLPIDPQAVPVFPMAYVPSEEASEAWALPLSNADTMRLGVSLPPQDPGVMQPQPATVAIERTDVDGVVDRINNDLGRFGATSVRISLADLSEAELAKLLSELQEAGVLHETPAAPMDVAQDLPDGFQLLSAEQGQCTTDEAWPMSVQSFETVMQHNEAVLAQAGVHAPVRARVLIVDSGLSPNLVQHQPFRPFLKPDRTHALRHGYYWDSQSTSDDRVLCDLGVNGETGVSPFGIVTSPEEGACHALKQFGDLAPVRTARMPARYVPDHGGIVGVLAAGGPRLMATDLKLHRYLGIGFARINSVETGTVRARDGDVAAAINYARDFNYNVVNMSLAFPYTSGSSAKLSIGCFVTPMENSRCSVRTDRLIVAAAGNDGQKVTQTKSNFPYELASNVQHANSNQFLVVGGIEHDAAGRPIPWKLSTHHDQLVDILAPSAGVVSLDGEANPVCMKGTSIAAPQVSFVAGMLFALGYTKASDVRERILATARFSTPDDPLFTRSRNGAVLDPTAAIDVFSDLIWVIDAQGKQTMKRGRLLAQQDDLKSVVLPVCAADSPGLRGSGGLSDVSRFALWRNTDGKVAEVWDPGFFTTSDQKCLFTPSEKIRFLAHDGDNEIEEYALSSVARIVPSHFRRALELHAQQQ